ncbi:hypothetical protein H4582DRAFT_2103631 [Lactarius indigo]|nr:hypothetical protein H4582DRAFT_2103631 [Lactarius indigo]
MPSMHQTQEMTSEEKWNAYKARQAARRQLQRGGITVTPPTPKPDPAGTIPVPEEPEKGMMPHPEISYSLSIDLSGVAAVEEEPCRPEVKSHSTTTEDDVPEWVIKRHLERRSGTIEVEAPPRGDAFVSEETLRTEDAPYGMTVASDEPEWVTRRHLAPTQRPSAMEDEAPIGRDAFALERTLESEQTNSRRTTAVCAPQTPMIEPGNRKNSPGSPEWTTVSYKKTTETNPKEVEADDLDGEEVLTQSSVPEYPEWTREGIKEPEKSTKIQ